MSGNDEYQCGECFGTEVEMVGTRERFAPDRERSRPAERSEPVAKTVWVRCTECGHSWSVTRPVLKGE